MNECVGKVCPSKTCSLSTRLSNAILLGSTALMCRHNINRYYLQLVKIKETTGKKELKMPQR